MQSVDVCRRLALAALCAVAAGCASLGESLNGLQASVFGTHSAPEPSPAAPASAAASAPSSAASAAQAPATAEVAAVAPPSAEPATPEEPPVDAAAQRTFDDARRALRAGRTADAERAFKALTVSHPDLGGAHANLGLIYRQAGKGAQAIAELEKAVAASPRQPIFFNQLGIAYRENGQFAKAREAYERAIAIDPHYAASLLNLGILNDLYLWDGKRALELYARYLALAPGGDTTVTKWVADLKNRKPQHALLTKKEKE